MGRLPAAVRGPEAHGPEKLVAPLHMHESVILKGALTFMRRFFEIPIQEFNPMRKTMALAFILAPAPPLPEFAKSKENQTACPRDVMWLCHKDIPDASRIVA